MLFVSRCQAISILEFAKTNRREKKWMRSESLEVYLFPRAFSFLEPLEREMISIEDV